MDFELLSPARRVVEGALGAVAGERLVVVADAARDKVRAAIVEAADWAKVRATCFALEELGAEPLSSLPAPVGDAFGRAQMSVYAGRAGAEELAFRRALVETAVAGGLRHAHMVGVAPAHMAAGMSIDPQRIADVARKIRARVRGHSVIAARSRAGTDLEVHTDARYRWVENSGVIRAGSWQNLPAGELLAPPAEASGRFVCDASLTQLAGVDSDVRERPLTLEIAHGRVTGVTCADTALARHVEHFTRSGANCDRVGLFSFGTNTGLAEPRGQVIADQILPGFHLVLGLTHSQLTGAEWDATGQLVLASTGTDIDIDGAALMRAGRYLL